MVMDLWTTLAQRIEQDDDLVFCSERGTLIDESNLLANVFYPALVRAGLPRLTFHAATRHTAATLMLAAGTHVRIVSERLGHADPGVTLRVYSHVTQTMQRGREHPGPRPGSLTRAALLQTLLQTRIARVGDQSDFWRFS